MSNMNFSIKNLSKYALLTFLVFLVAYIAYPTNKIQVIKTKNLAAKSNYNPIGIADYSDTGYWIAASDGGVFSFGKAPFYGSLGGKVLSSPITAITQTMDNQGYYLLGKDGAVYAFGDAQFKGGINCQPGATSGACLVSGASAIGIASTQSGYYITDNKGNVYAFGDAQYFGNAIGSSGITSIATSRSGNGYWLASNTGQVYAFGDAQYFGNVDGSTDINNIIINNGNGYCLSAKSGKVSCKVSVDYGDSSSLKPVGGIVGIIPSFDGNGYWQLGGDGGVFAFGSARYSGRVTAKTSIAKISASSTSIIAGQNIKLNWKTRHAVSAYISNIGNVALSGNTIVSPTKTTTYAITSIGNAGNNTDSVTINVTQPTPVVGSTQTFSGQTFGPNSTILQYKNYKFVMQSDGNAVVYFYGSPLWSSNTYGHNGAFMRLQTDGNMVIYSTTGEVLWKTNTSNSQTGGYGGRTLQMAFNGSFVIFSSNGKLLWPLPPPIQAVSPQVSAFNSSQNTTSATLPSISQNNQQSNNTNQNNYSFNGNNDISIREGLEGFLQASNSVWIPFKQTMENNAGELRAGVVSFSSALTFSTACSELAGTAATVTEFTITAGEVVGTLLAVWAL
jgi:hypothetical protein